MISVNKLVLFAGPPASGKSTLIQELQMGRINFLSQKLGLDNISLWRCIETQKLHELSDLHIDRLILQYDFLRQWKLKYFNQNYEEDGPLDILNSSTEIIFVTLWIDPSILIKRIAVRQLDALTQCKNPFKFFVFLRSVHTRKRLKQLYSNVDELLCQYDKWLKFCETYTTKSHWILKNTEDVPILYPLSKWSQVVKEFE